MIRNTLMAAAVAVTAGILVIPQTADANHRSWHDDDVNVQLNLGIGTPSLYHYPGRYRISCGQARGILRDRGYYRIQTRECQGRTYTFRADKNGRRFVVWVNSRNGSISRDRV